MQAQIEELCRDRFFKSMHDGIHSELHHLISDVPAAKKLKFFKLVEGTVTPEEQILQTKKKIECRKDTKATTFIPQTPWKPKSLAAKLADIGLEFSDDSKNEFMSDKNKDTSITEDAVDEDLLEHLETLSCHATVVLEEDRKGVCYLCSKKGHQMVDCDLKLLIKNAQRGLGMKLQAPKVKDPSRTSSQTTLKTSSATDWKSVVGHLPPS